MTGSESNTARSDAPDSQGGLSVLIVNWNTRDHLSACLEGLAAGALPPGSEVVVLDNASSDGSADMVEAEFPWVKLVRNETNTGFAAGVNGAAREATGDLLLFLNSDTVLGPNTIEECRDYLLANDDVAVVGCRLTFPDGRPQSSTFRFPSLRGVFLTSAWLSQCFPKSPMLNWDRYGLREWDVPVDVDVTMGSFLLLRRSALGREVPLDEGYFMYGEECDMCCELKSKGWRTVHYPRVSLVHVHGGSTRAPRLAGWAAEAKARGVLRFLWRWRGASVAWLANGMMLLGLMPRVVAWGLADLASSARSGKLQRNRLHKAQVMRFHLATLVRPSAVQEPWGGPDAVRTDHA